MGKEFWQRKFLEKLEKEGLVDRRIMEDYCFRHKDDDVKKEQEDKKFNESLEEESISIKECDSEFEEVTEEDFDEYDKDSDDA